MGSNFQLHAKWLNFIPNIEGMQSPTIQHGPIRSLFHIDLGPGINGESKTTQKSGEISVLKSPHQFMGVAAAV